MLQVVARLVGLTANMIPLAGILYWGWDTFQLLNLYWVETVILAFWTLMRLSRLSPEACGTITVNGKEQQATPPGLVGFFSLHAGMFILVHAVFLWVLFSGAWLKTIHSVGEFFFGLFVAHGLWIGLLMMFVTHLISFIVNPRPAPPPPGPDGKAGDPVGAIIASLYIRIVIMQVAIIGGAWFADISGSMAPLLIVIGLKTLIDLAGGVRNASLSGASFSSTSSSIWSKRKDVSKKT